MTNGVTHVEVSTLDRTLSKNTNGYCRKDIPLGMNYTDPDQDGDGLVVTFNTVKDFESFKQYRIRWSSFKFLISCNMFTRTTQPTGSPSMSPTHFGPTAAPAAPVTSIPSFSPVISSPTETPTFSPVSTLPRRNPPVTSSATVSPILSPSKPPKFYPSNQPGLSFSTAAPIAAPVLFSS